MTKIDITGDDCTNESDSYRASVHFQYPPSMMQVAESPIHISKATWVLSCPDCRERIEYIGNNKPVECPHCGVEWNAPGWGLFDDDWLLGVPTTCNHRVTIRKDRTVLVTWDKSSPTWEQYVPKSELDELRKGRAIWLLIGALGIVTLAVDVAIAIARGLL